ncbi:C-C motif chemokine 13-like [Clarias magur]|uniref:C-C motif chemokine 13-like n=1 Tax=Clarias magur TaxID=1594786 RepID=A0A8J4WPV8_CLAMG|nr:C-C motif chemokine 13-like [Clarias magur]
MKMSRVCLVLGFVLIMGLYTDALLNTLDSLAKLKNCCFTFPTDKIHPKKVLDVKRTGPHCNKKGFLVTTTEHKTICVRENPIKGKG